MSDESRLDLLQKIENYEHYLQQLAFLRGQIETIPNPLRKQEFRQRAERIEKAILHMKETLLNTEDLDDEDGGMPVPAFVVPGPPTRFGRDAKPMPRDEDGYGPEDVNRR